MAEPIPYTSGMTPERLTSLWLRFQERWIERNERIELIDRVVRGDWSVLDPADDPLDTRSPNMVQVALEDTAEAASLVPTIRVSPSSPDDDSREVATKMERLAISFLEASEVDIKMIRDMMSLSGRGFFAGVCTLDPELGPRIEWRDPRTCFPEPDMAHLSVVRRGFFARDLFLTQLPEDWQQKITVDLASKNVLLQDRRYEDQKVTFIEYYDEHCTILAAVHNSATVPWAKDITTRANAISVILAEYENKTGMCPIFYGQRPTFDGEPRGQFDQVISVLEGHIRLMAMVLDYADQAVYSDVWVKDLIGNMPIGGGSYIQLGPQGDIGRVPPAVSSLQVFDQLQMLMENIHLGARYPKTRPGDIDQAIASGKFVEATVGVMNTVIRTYHFVMARALEQALRVLFKLDQAYGKVRAVSGVMRNQQFVMAHDPKTDIDMAANIRVDYGVGLGRDPAQSAVLGIQYAQAGIVSMEYVQENTEGIVDVGLERARIDTEQMRDMAKAKLLQGLESGQVPESALVKIAKARMHGDDIFDLYEKYIVKPQEEAAAEMVPTGLSGMVPPGPGAPAGQQAPTPPSGEDLLAGLFGGGGGQPAPPESIGRLSVPLPGGGFAGTQSTGGGAPA